MGNKLPNMKNIVNHIYLVGMLWKLIDTMCMVTSLICYLAKHGANLKLPFYNLSIVKYLCTEGFQEEIE